MGLTKLLRSPVFFGAAVAIFVTGFQVGFREVVPPAYGICTICHARDLLSWIINQATRFPMDTPSFAIRAIVLTPVGLVAGSFLVSWKSGEFSWTRPFNPVIMLFGGAIVSMSGLLIMSCPTRLVLRLAYGDTFALFAAAGLFAGIAVSALILRRVR